jgi:hypothetical protein
MVLFAGRVAVLAIPVTVSDTTIGEKIVVSRRWLCR